MCVCVRDRYAPVGWRSQSPSGNVTVLDSIQIVSWRTHRNEPIFAFCDYLTLANNLTNLPFSRTLWIVISFHREPKIAIRRSRISAQSTPTAR